MWTLPVIWRRIRDSFWFIPVLCLVGAAVLAQVLVALDRGLPADLASPWLTWVYAGGVDGSRALLSAVGASMLGVASTAFSITMSVIATASSTYGPRLVRNFMADRGNQVVLGMLVATFLYAVLVLRTIRSSDEELGDSFVPHLAVNVAVGLAVVDVVLLVYFIHHIADSIQVDTLAREARGNFRATVDRWHPPDIPEDQSRTTPRVPEDGPITAGQVGYLMGVNFQKLKTLAADTDVVLELVPQLGDHLLAAQTLVRVWPGDRAQELVDRIRDCVQIGDSRSTDQDLRFAEQQIVEMAVRALSPGTNDPYTAVNAIEEVADGICAAVSRPDPTDTLLMDGVVRVHHHPVGLNEIVDMPFHHLRPHAPTHVPVVLALVDLAARIEQSTIHPTLAVRVREHVRALHRAVSAADPDPCDLARVEHHITAAGFTADPPEGHVPTTA